MALITELRIAHPEIAFVRTIEAHPDAVIRAESQPLWRSDGPIVFISVTAPDQTPVSEPMTTVPTVTDFKSAEVTLTVGSRGRSLGKRFQPHIKSGGVNPTTYPDADPKVTEDPMTADLRLQDTNAAIGRAASTGPARRRSPRAIRTHQ